MPEEAGCWNDLATENARLRSANAKLVEALRLVPGALTAAYEQAHAEWQGHDVRGSRCDEKVMACRQRVATAIAESEAQP